jgi:hypothetical protein
MEDVEGFYKETLPEIDVNLKSHYSTPMCWAKLNENESSIVGYYLNIPALIP